MEELIRWLEGRGVLRSPRLKAALQAVDRADFIPPDLRAAAYLDEPLPIGQGQTISQPYTVVFMLEALGVAPGHRVLEIGYGSAWQTALLAYLVGDQGVFALEGILDPGPLIGVEGKRQAGTRVQAGRDRRLIERRGGVGKLVGGIQNAGA